MQTKSKEQSGYLTIYLSLIFGIILSLLLALVEGAAIGATRLQAELVTDISLDSVFAEYHRELLKQYGVFYIDDSYGNEKGSIGRVEQHMDNYMRYNCNPWADGRLGKGNCLLQLDYSYLEIEKASFATDDFGEVWKAQAIDYMKEYYGINNITDCANYLNTVSGKGLVTRDIASEISQNRNKYEQGLRDKEIEETDVTTEEGYSYSQINDMLDSIMGMGVLTTVAPEVSGKAINRQKYVSLRKTNHGSGLHEGIEKPDKMTDELIYGEYLLQKCGHYRNVKNNSPLDYEVEYILYGHESDMANLRECAERLLAMRTAANYLYLTEKDTVKKAEVEVVAALICTLLAAPELTDALSSAMLGGWAYTEAVADVKCLLRGGKVSIIKQKDEWNTDLWGLLKNGFHPDNIQGHSSDSGLSYQDYLRLFLGLMNRKDKVMRSLDIVEMNIQQTPGNTYFRIDQCISYLEAGFGYEDASGHEYVLTRAMGYQ